MESDRNVPSDIEMMDSFPDIDLLEYTAPQVHSSRHLDPSILELDAEQALALGLPAVPLSRLPYDDDFGGARWVEKKDFLDAHHHDLFRLPALNGEEVTNSFALEETLKADSETEDAIDDNQKLVGGTRQDSVIKRCQKRQYVETVDEPEAQDASSNHNDTDPMRRTKRPRLATPPVPSQEVSFKSQHDSQTDPIIVESEDDTPQTAADSSVIIDSDSEEDNTTRSQDDPINIDSEDKDDSSQPDPAAPTTPSTSTTTTSSSSSSFRAPPRTWTTDLRFLINEVVRDDGDFNASGLQCAQVIKALYPNFALAHLPDKELAKRVNAQWKERDYPNRPDWVRIRAMRTGDEGMRAGIRGRIRGTGILN